MSTTFGCCGFSSAGTRSSVETAAHDRALEHLRQRDGWRIPTQSNATEDAGITGAAVIAEMVHNWRCNG